MPFYMLSKYTIEQKRDVLINDFGTYKSILKRNYQDNYERKEDENGVIHRYPSYWSINFLDYIHSIPKYDCARLLDLSQRRKRQRISNKIYQFVLSGNGIFVTLTFSEEVLASTTKETRRRYVARYLKTQSETYVANIDFGGKNGREHYHAIVAKNCDLKQWKDKYGMINVKRIRNTKDDLNRVKNYVAKLTNHALKNTTKQADRLLFSRNLKEL